MCLCAFFSWGDKTPFFLLLCQLSYSPRLRRKMGFEPMTKILYRCWSLCKGGSPPLSRQERLRVSGIMVGCIKTHCFWLFHRATPNPYYRVYAGLGRDSNPLPQYGLLYESLIPVGGGQMAQDT